MNKQKVWLIIFAVILVGVGIWISQGGTILRLSQPSVEVIPTPTKVSATLVLEFSEEDIATYSGIQLEKPATVFGILEKAAQDNKIELVTKQYDFGIFVESIGGVENSKERSWIYFVNGKSGEVASDKYEISEGDLIEWRYIKPIF